MRHPTRLDHVGSSLTLVGVSASTAKVSISMEKSALAWAKRVARRRKVSLSTVISEAVRQTQQAEARDRLLEMLGAADLSEDELERVRREWRG